MKLRALRVASFGCIRKANVEFAPGLNLLHGPNDLGKSSLLEAVRAALLLPHTSSAHQKFISWGHPELAPQVELVFELEAERIYRVRKQFGATGKSSLEVSRDGLSYTQEAQAREVDSRLRKLLRWGLAEPGRGKRAMPGSFLVTALLGTQSQAEELFQRALSADEDSSGRDLIRGALEALAEDPRFKQVLSQASEQVKRAFTSTGMKQRGRTHFWVQLKQQLTEADERVRELIEQQTASETVQRELLKREEELAELHEEANAAQIALARAEKRLAKQLEWSAAEARLVTAAQAVKRLDTAAKAEAEAAQAVSAAEAEVIRAESLVTAARQATEQAAQGLKTAEAQHVQLEGDAAVQLVAFERLNSEKQQLVRQLEDAQREQAQAEAAAGLVKKANETAKLHADAVQRLTQAETKHAELTQLVTAESAARVEAERAEAWLEILAQEAEVERLRGLLAGRSKQQAELAELEAEISRVEKKLKRAELPSAAALSSLEQRRRACELAEQRLEVGLELRVVPESPPLQLWITADGERREHSAGEGEGVGVAARQRLELELPGVARIEVQAGSPEDRARATALRVELDGALAVVLKAAGVTSWEQLEKLLAAAARLAELRQSREQAVLTLAAGAETAARLAELEQASATARQAFVAPPAPLGAGPTPEQLPALLTAARGAVARATQALSRLSGEQTAAERAAQQAQADARVLVAELERDQADAAAAALALEAAAKGAAPPAERVKDLQRALAELEQRLALATAERGAALGAAAERLAQASREHTAARAAQDRAEETRVQALQAEATAKSRLETQKEQQLEVDPASIHAERERARAAESDLKAQLAELAGCAVTELTLLTEAELEAAKQRAAEAATATRLKQSELDTLRGSLTQVGGDVVTERLREARAAQQQILAELDAKDLEFGGWKLLQESLEAAAKEEDTNLGAVLAAPVAARFSELTGGRYGRLSLSAGLQATGIAAAGGERQLEELSAGTQEQLATLLRLTLAEQLQTTLVLDDQLSQTDSARYSWFQEKLLEVAKTTQLVLITCFPERGEFLANAGANCVDLGKVIERE